MNFAPNHILIVGAGHGIGFALTKQSVALGARKIFACYKNSDKAEPLLSFAKEYKHIHCLQLDYLQEEQFKRQFDFIKGQLNGSNLDMVVNAVGFLSTSSVKPEKSLKDITFSHLMTYFQVNSCVTPMLAKYAKSLLSHDTPSVFAALSAKVGSIDDNQLGGWYGYRASKTALNMLIKNIAIEFKQSQLPTKVFTLHPGTTHTELSKPFMAHLQHKIWTAEETAAHLMEVLLNTRQPSGSFINWDGNTIEW